MDDELVPKRRRVIIAEDEDDNQSLGSNPDVDYEYGEELEEPEGDEEDLMDNIYE